MLVLRDLPDLVELSITGGQVTDRGMATIAGFAKLRSLILVDVPVTDAGVVHVAKLARLKRLMLIGAPISDAGVAVQQKS